jgi:hypothetical protein
VRGGLLMSADPRRVSVNELGAACDVARCGVDGLRFEG